MVIIQDGITLERGMILAVCGTLKLEVSEIVAFVVINFAKGNMLSLLLL